MNLLEGLPEDAIKKGKNFIELFGQDNALEVAKLIEQELGNEAEKIKDPATSLKLRTRSNFYSQVADYVSKHHLV